MQHHHISAAELATVGFQPLELRVRSLELDLASGRGCEWTAVSEVPDSSGLYAFTVEDDHEMRVAYVGRTEHLWMVTKGRLPGGGGRGGQRYGRPRHAGASASIFSSQSNLGPGAWCGIGFAHFRRRCFAPKSNGSSADGNCVGSAGTVADPECSRYRVTPPRSDQRRVGA